MLNFLVVTVLVSIVVSKYLNQENYVDNTTHIFGFKSTNSHHIKLFETIKNIFREEPNLIFENEYCNQETCHTKFYHLDVILKDRTCLLASPTTNERIRFNFSDDFEINAMINFVNIRMNTFRSIDGNLTEIGHKIKKYSSEPYKIQSTDICEKIPLTSLSSELFLTRYLLPQRPVVISGLELSHINIIEDLLTPYLHDEVGVKLSDSIDFEGIDYLHHWENPQHKQTVPPEVLSQLESPDRVVVRAAHQDMSLASFLKLLARNSNNNFNISAIKKFSSKSNVKPSSSTSRIHAYVEYLDLNSHLLGLGAQLSTYMQQLNQTLSLPFLEGTPYLWLGDGHTVGKLHFDPYDNILIQLEGSKSFELVDVSDNERLYEGHIREAQLDIIIDEKVKENLLDNKIGTTSPIDPQSSSRPVGLLSKRLLESTSMVHSPIRLHHPQDLMKYPKAADISTLTCVVRQGEAIYVPSFFWHEVTSAPPIRSNSKAANAPDINMALNYWFPSLFKKEFPCAHCKKKFNVKYRERLVGLI